MYLLGTKPSSSSLSAMSHPETYSPVILISSPKYFFFFKLNHKEKEILCFTSGKRKDIHSSLISRIGENCFPNVWIGEFIVAPKITTGFLAQKVD